PQQAARYQRGLKNHFILEGDTLFPLPNLPLPRFYPAAELRGILLIKFLAGSCLSGLGIVLKEPSTI
ncbi:MAG TPA: hypothetical protein VMW95_05435, partial [Desulfobacterales bacterium]|nr:hypothetical protein [Desulfobacterales bacterium]